MRDLAGKSIGVGCHFLLQGIFPTQGSNLGLLHCRQTLYCLSHQGNPVIGLHNYRPSIGRRVTILAVSTWVLPGDLLE